MLKNEYIFISYKREDSIVANRIKNALESKNIRIWWDEKLQTGQKWEEKIDHMLYDSSVVLVLWSNLSIESDWVKHEASYAATNRKLVQAKISECTLPGPFQSRMATDLINWDERNDNQKFIDLVSEIYRVVRVGRAKRILYLSLPAFPSIALIALYFAFLHTSVPNYPITNGLIADFNGPAGAGALTSYGLPFSLMSDSSQNMESKVWYHRTNEGTTQNGFMKIFYQLIPSSNREAYVGVYFDFSLPPAQPVNLSKYSGVRLKMRINQESNDFPEIRVVLYSDNIKNYEYAYPIARIFPTNQWNTYTIPFGDFTSPPHAYNIASLDKSRVFRVGIIIIGNSEKHGNIDIDDIFLFKS